jgi:hypothetical protein
MLESLMLRGKWTVAASIVSLFRVVVIIVRIDR